jgi:hypothetical protein
MKTLKVLLVLALLCSFYVSCKKTETGPAGATGATGSANVKYSTWNTLNMTYSTADSMYEQTITADSITQNILDNGVILTYLKSTDTTTGVTTIVNANTFFQELFTVGSIKLFSFLNFSGYSYRYIVIPGGIRAGRIAAGNLSGYSKAELEAMSYEDVIRLTGEK